MTSVASRSSSAGRSERPVTTARGPVGPAASSDVRAVPVARAVAVDPPGGAPSDPDDRLLALIALHHAHEAAADVLRAVDRALDATGAFGKPPHLLDDDAVGVALTELWTADALHRAALATAARGVPATLLDFLR